ncbi:hypothetical protein [Rhizobium sp. BK251]|uniref:hypothetical protein n=1 Tax=Rhizobium sp. BK251 TaxID=2512125 RepID=UPI001052ECF4|nr:hypothetical protein [Rhizobium sp. BK251]TCL70408.1 hypothetical protein EV286_107279 [Rhizobium sp. BK251]
MVDAQFSQSDDAKMAIGQISGLMGRVQRSVSYFVASAILIYASAYDLRSPALIALTIGILGLTSASAKVGQLGIAILLLLAVFSPEMLGQLSTGLKSLAG